MDRRFALALVLSFLVLLLSQIWLAPKSARRPRAGGADSAAVETLGSPTASRGAVDSSAPPTLAEALPGGTAPGDAILPDSVVAFSDRPEQLIPVANASAKAMFTDRGGRLIEWTLEDYASHEGHPVEIAQGQGELGIVLETESGEVDLRETPFRYRSEPGKDGAKVLVFEASVPGGLSVVKRFTVPAEGYLVDLDVQIAGDERVTGYRLVWDRSLPHEKTSKRLDRSADASIALLGKDVEKLTPGSFKKEPRRELAGNVRWAGVRSKYFWVAMVPPPETSSRVVATGDPATPNNGVELAMPLLRGEGNHRFHVYMGPLDYSVLRAIGHDLDQGVDLGWKLFRWLSQQLLVTMEWMYRFLPNYGIVIIIVSALTKLIFYPLTRTSVRSMRAMQVIQPELNALREKYKGDPPRMQKEMMELYKKNKVNPLGGCIPMLVQMPVFIALYSVLANAIEMRQAPFMLWMNDLSIPDTLFTVGGFAIHVLPVVMFVTTLLQQKLTPVADPRQKLMGYLMPAMMLFIFYSFPAGLNLYWTVNNILTVGQQWQIHREVANEQKAAA